MRIPSRYIKPHIRNRLGIPNVADFIIMGHVQVHSADHNSLFPVALLPAALVHRQWRTNSRKAIWNKRPGYVGACQAEVRSSYFQRLECTDRSRTLEHVDRIRTREYLDRAFGH